MIGNPPLIPDSGYISLGTVANALGGHPDVLISTAERFGIPLESQRWAV